MVTVLSVPLRADGSLRLCTQKPCTPRGERGERQEMFFTAKNLVRVTLRRYLCLIHAQDSKIVRFGSDICTCRVRVHECGGRSGCCLPREALYVSPCVHVLVEICTDPFVPVHKMQYFFDLIVMPLHAESCSQRVLHASTSAPVVNRRPQV